MRMGASDTTREIRAISMSDSDREDAAACAGFPLGKPKYKYPVPLELPKALLRLVLLKVAVIVVGDNI